MSMVLFDCDGVLLDSELLADQVIIDYFATRYPKLDWSIWWERMAGLSVAVILKAMAEEYSIEIPADAEDEILQLLDRRLRDEVQAIPGVDGALRAIGHPKAVVSNSHTDYLHSLLGKVDLLHYFDGRVYGSNLVENGKPDPELYLLAAREATAAVTDCVVIEDSVPGMSAAVAAGMATIGFVGGGHVHAALADRLRAVGADVIVDDMCAVPDQVKRLLREM